MSRDGQITLESENLNKGWTLCLAHSRAVSVQAHTKSCLLATWALHQDQTQRPKTLLRYGGEHRACCPIYSVLD